MATIIDDITQILSESGSLVKIVTEFTKNFRKFFCSGLPHLNNIWYIEIVGIAGPVEISYVMHMIMVTCYISFLICS